MAGAIGAVAGDIAYRYGYQRFDSQIMRRCCLLVALVAVIQLGGDRLAQGLNKR